MHLNPSIGWSYLLILVTGAPTGLSGFLSRSCASAPLRDRNVLLQDESVSIAMVGMHLVMFRARLGLFTHALKTHVLDPLHYRAIDLLVDGIYYVVNSYHVN